MPADAIARYHELLAPGALADDTAAALARLQDLRGLHVGRRPVCSVLRPRLLSPDRYRFARRQCEALLPALRTVYERAVRDAQFRLHLRLREWEQSVFDIDPGYTHPVATSRMDAFLGPDGTLKFTEYNAETPAGAMYADALAEVFFGLPAMQELARDYHLSPLPCRPGLLHALTDAFRQWAGTSNTPPRVAILDWKESPTVPEFGLVAEYLRRMGIAARTADPRELEYADGVLRAGDFPISLVYKRVLARELIEPHGPDHPLVRAARDRAVCVVNSFRCRMLARKATFAVLTDERHAELFPAPQRAVIAAHVPWTRVVEERKTTFAGAPVDLVPFVSAHRERFVLKPNEGHGGRGVVLGWATDAVAWERAVTAALAEPWVVQERIPAAVEPFPVAEDGGIRVAERVIDTGLFVASGGYAHGCLTRASADPIISVGGNGGAALPTFLVERR